MATLHATTGRLIAFAVTALAPTGVPAIAASVGPGPTDVVHSATCPPGEQQDPVTFICAPGSAPDAVGVAPGLNEQWQEQDIYGTPGEQPGQAGGTTVP